jgi:Holliday junction DNA helicase RuvB
LLKRVRDICEVKYDGIITEEVARAALERFEIDELGLDDFDRRMLKTIIHNYGGGPVGLDTLAAGASFIPGVGSIVSAISGVAATGV